MEILKNGNSIYLLQDDAVCMYIYMYTLSIYNYIYTVTYIYIFVSIYNVTYV